MDSIISTIFPEPPYDFDLTVGYHTYYRSRYGTDCYVYGEYRRLLNIGNKLILASVRSIGTVEYPKLEMTLEGTALTSTDVGQAKSQIEWILGTSQNLNRFYESIVHDQPLNDFGKIFYGLHLPHTQSPYEALILAVLGQQISTNVAHLIRTLMIEKYGSAARYRGMNYYSFPQPIHLAEASLEDLRLLKMSYRKAEYILGISRIISEQSNLLEFESLTEDQEIITEITRLRGVGRWTAQWLLIRGLGRMDAFPIGDLALNQMVSKIYFDDTPVTDYEIAKFSERWSPWRTYATIYLFAANRRGLI